MAVSRRFFVHSVLALPASVALALGGVEGSSQAAAPPPATGANRPKSFDLQKQLDTGLKARRPEDFKYIKSIVAKVEAGTLPRKLVDQSFMYARQRSTTYPIIYFQYTLKELAKKARVTL